MEGTMDINTGKLASNSINLLKKLKENDSNLKVNEKNKTNELSNIVESDLLDLKSTEKTFKNRIINIKNQITQYENEFSKTQYIAQQLDVLNTLLEKNGQTEIYKIIKDSNFNNENLIKSFFTDDKDLKTQLFDAKKLINEKLSSLDKDFNTIMITTQNIISLYSNEKNVSNESFKNLNLNDAIKSTQLNNKRVLNLIS